MTFEQYLREHGYILDRVYKTSHEWVQLAEEWHAAQIEPLRKEWESSTDYDKEGLYDSWAELCDAIFHVVEWWR